MPPPSEATLLSRYLLPPSSLPTILPYTTFLSLLPSNLRSTITNDPQSATAQLVKRLYKDLQFQRDIDIDTVRQNIQQECARSEVLRARLRREVREEMGDNLNGNNVKQKDQANGSAKKRKRDMAYVENEDDEVDSEQDQLSISSDSEGEESTTLTEAHPTTTVDNRSKTNSSNATAPHSQLKQSYDSLHDPLETRIDTLFSGPRGLAAPTTILPSQQRYHTTTSLLQAMQQSVQDLEKEISDLDAQAGVVLDGMKETVGGMSDLRYGKFARVSGAGEATEEVEGVEGQVTQALRELKEVVGRKTRGKGMGK